MPENVIQSQIVPNTQDISQLYGMPDTTAQTSYLDSQMKAGSRGGFDRSRQSQRASTRSPRSRYRNIPTTNVKFMKFIDLIFKSRMQTDEVKDEIIKYVQALETSYTDAIRDLKNIIDKEKR